MVPMGIDGQQQKRFEVLGSQISCVDMDAALGLLQQRIQSNAGGYVCFTNVHAVVTGLQDKTFRDITNASFMSLADGKPVYWAARSQPEIGHVAGPDFMRAALQRLRHEGHYFYGSTPEVLEKLENTLREKIPGVNIAGMYSPPFHAPSTEELQAHYEKIRESGATLIWVGLGAPKQERWMAAASPKLHPAILLGVGAAFDFHANVVPRAPELMRKLGLEWFYRLLRQPRRLWKRYLVTNTYFVVNMAKQYMKRLFDRKS